MAPGATSRPGRHSEQTCSPGDDPALASRLTAVTGIQFEPTDHSYKHLIELVVTGDPAQLGADLQKFISAMDSCAAKTATSTATSKLTVKQMAIPQLGDQRVAYLTITPVNGAAFYGRGAMVRFRSVAVVVGLTEGLYSPRGTPQISDSTFVSIVKTAYDKLAG